MKDPNEEVILLGCDIATASPYSPTRGVVAVVAIEYPSLNVMTSSYHLTAIDNPYQTGFLAKREGEPMIDALKSFLDTSQLAEKASKVILFIDGAGQLHPKKYGLACHIGEAIDIPTIGITKHYLIGQENQESAKSVVNNGFRALATEMWMDGEQRGWKIQKIDEKKNESLRPIYASVGWALSLAKTLTIAVGTMKHRIPEPIRQADHLARQELRKSLKKSKNRY